jgi:acetamidase/formamidase
MTFHKIEPEAGNVHGYFSNTLPPILTIEPGDTVQYRTLDAGWGLEPQHPDGSLRKTLPLPSEDHQGHALCGPIAVRGAKPGMALVVQINAIVPGTFGYCNAGWGWARGLHRRLGIPKQKTTHYWTLDPAAMTARNQHGHTVKLHPFMGVMGLAPVEPGVHDTAPPRNCGGNIDCKDLVVSSTLYLPIEVEGALFSVGDGHGVQGHGEVSGTAIECPMERVELTFDLREDTHLAAPCAHTPVGWIAFGFHRDLDEAVWTALNGILDILMHEYQVSRSDALALASLVVDMHITQLVNGARGVHAVLPHGAIR